MEWATRKWVRSYSTVTYILCFGLVIAVPLLVLLGALLLQMVSAERHDLQQRVMLVLNSIRGDVDRELDRDITILRTLATSQALSEADWPAFYNQAKVSLQGRAYLVLVDAEGRQLVNTYVPYGLQPPLSGDMETVRKITQTKSPVVSNLFTSLVVKQPVFNVSIPVITHGKVQYIMSLGLLPKDLTNLLASEKPGPGWISLIWDEHGRLLARSIQKPGILGAEIPASVRKLVITQPVRTTNLDGTDVIYAAAKLSSSNWTVGVNVPYAQITQQMRHSLLLWGGAAYLAIAAALILGAFIARQITSALRTATNAALAFGRDEPQTMESSGLDEANTFLATLQNAQQALSKARAHQKLLMRELQHRSQNVFAVIQAIVHRSFKDGANANDLKRVINGRIAALSRSHLVLGSAEWKGASLEDILKGELGDSFAESVDFEGCETVLNADAAQHFALIFHELTTNAVKYGALSNSGGRISVVGSKRNLDGEPHFALSWSERGGPCVNAPVQKGFGSTILFDVARQFGMDVSVSYDAEGLAYKLSTPLSKIEGAGSTA